MTDNPTPTHENNTPTSKIVGAGVGIALGSIFLFGAIWLGLGQLGVADAVRLVLAVCTPPGIMTVVVLWLYFTRRPPVA
jgi:lipopolysaccharide export LptBFGC system permease protein LptF